MGNLTNNTPISTSVPFTQNSPNPTGTCVSSRVPGNLFTGHSTWGEGEKTRKRRSSFKRDMNVEEEF